MIKSFAHTMIRVKNLQESIRFYTEIMGLELVSKTDYPAGKFTLAFLGVKDNPNGSKIELTHNWEREEDYELGNAFGHLAFYVKDIVLVCDKIRQSGGIITREPGVMKFGGSSNIAFVKDLDGYLIELIEEKNQ